MKKYKFNVEWETDEEFYKKSGEYPSREECPPIVYLTESDIGESECFEICMNKGREAFEESVIDYIQEKIWEQNDKMYEKEGGDGYADSDGWEYISREYKRIKKITYDSDMISMKKYRVDIHLSYDIEGLNKFEALLNFTLSNKNEHEFEPEWMEKCGKITKI